MTTPPEIIWQIVLISIGMVLFSQLFQKKFALSREDQMAMQERIQILQERLRLAQSNGDTQEFRQLNMEMMEIMNGMMKKQLIPMCVRLLIFFGIFAILRALYGQYDDIFPFPILFFGKGWMALYFVVSFVMGLIIAGLKAVYRKINPNANKNNQLYDQARILQKNIMFAGSHPLASQSETSSINSSIYGNGTDNFTTMGLNGRMNLPRNSWKNKLQQSNNGEIKKEKSDEDQIEPTPEIPGRSSKDERSTNLKNSSGWKKKL